MKILFTYETKEIGANGTRESCYELPLSQFAFLDILKNGNKSKHLRLALGMIKRYEELQFRELDECASVSWCLIGDDKDVKTFGDTNIMCAD